MTRDEALARLAAMGHEKIRAVHARQGAEGEQFGVKLGDIRALAKEIEADHALALALWDSGNFEARLLAILLMKPRALSADALDTLVRSNGSTQVSDWLNAYVVKTHPEKEALRRRWMDPAETSPMAARAGWSLTAERVAKDSDGLDLAALLDRIEADLAAADPLPQWTMNVTLANIGIHHPALRGRALAVGEALGVYRDWPVAAGCTSPFAPDWIGEMVRRQGTASRPVEGGRK